MLNIKFEGDSNHIEVHQHIYNVSHDSNVKKATTSIFQPLERDGIETVEIKDRDGDSYKFGKDAAKDILGSCRLEDDDKVDNIDTIEAVLRVYAPVFDADAENWRFEFLGDHIYADITETNIASDAIRRGGALIGDAYKVVMTITEYSTPTGQKRKRYKLLQVLEFMPASQQPRLL